MVRLMAMTLLSLLAAMLLDSSTAQRSKRRHVERAPDITRWEGEGGSVMPAPKTSAD